MAAPETGWALVLARHTGGDGRVMAAIAAALDSGKGTGAEALADRNKAVPAQAAVLPIDGFHHADLYPVPAETPVIIAVR